MTPDGGSRRGAGRRDSILVRYGGQQYERDLAKCRRALLLGKAEKRFRNLAEFARQAGLSQPTASKFLNGAGQGSRDTTSRILAGLRLTFDEVHRKVDQAREQGRAMTAT
jgi:transcriptional regulator with XRE-family HTH domain